MSKAPGDDGSLVEDVLPLSPLQQGLLFHALFDESAQDVYTMQSLVEIEGALRPTLLRTAAEELFARHANLRSAFLHEDLDEPVQVVLKQVPVHWSEAAAADEDEAARLIAEDATARFDLTDPPLLRLTLVRRATDRWLLILTNHHLLLDGWSIPLLVRELLQIYAAQLAPGATPPCPPYARTGTSWPGSPPATARPPPTPGARRWPGRHRPYCRRRPPAWSRYSLSCTPCGSRRDSRAGYRSSRGAVASPSTRSCRACGPCSWPA